MKRTTIYLEPALEMRLKMEGLRRKQPMAELVREAVEAYLGGEPMQGPPGAGAFASGRRDTADRAEEVLAETDFGGAPPAPVKRPSTRLGTGPSTKLGTGPSTKLGTGPSTKLGTGPSTKLGTGRAKRRA
jgi:hypothetical protein